MPALTWEEVANLLVFNMTETFELTCLNIDQAANLANALRKKGLNVKRVPYSAVIEVAPKD